MVVAELGQCTVGRQCIRDDASAGQHETKNFTKQHGAGFVLNLHDSTQSTTARGVTFETLSQLASALSLNMAPLHRSHTTYCWCAFLSTAVSCRLPFAR